jgi:short-subunit dehydrogenase
MPFMSTYAASKAFLLHWSEGVSAELKSTGVRCVTICPGTIHTGFATASDIPLGALPGVALVTCSLDSVVDTVLASIQSNTAVAIPGIGNRIATFSARLVPRALIRWLMAAVLGRAYSAD